MDQPKVWGACSKDTSVVPEVRSPITGKDVRDTDSSSAAIGEGLRTAETVESSSIADKTSPTGKASDGGVKAAPAKLTAPAYPTSSKKGPQNWDNLDVDDSDNEESKDPDHFFKKLFSGATPEQQRAMMKSFVESNGTALSTDWDDVKNRKVETVPPEGVEAKKWNQ